MLAVGVQLPVGVVGLEAEASAGSASAVQIANATDLMLMANPLLAWTVRREWQGTPAPALTKALNRRAVRGYARLIPELATPHGPARVHLREAEAPRAALVLGHGAGGGVESPDLVGAANAANAAGLSVALFEQPYRVAGRRSPAPARQLDEAWLAVVPQLFPGLPLLVGGRSLGARVACRTAHELGAVAVLCLAFPVHPPGRPEKSRLPELDAVEVPTLVVQGESDPFGMPPDGPGRTVVRIPGTHSLRSSAAVAEAVSAWLETVV